MDVKKETSEKKDFFVILSEDKKAVEIIHRHIGTIKTSVTCQEDEFPKEGLEKTQTLTDRWDIDDPSLEMYTSRVEHFERTGSVQVDHGIVHADILETATQTDITTVKPKPTVESLRYFNDKYRDVLACYDIDIEDMVFQLDWDDDSDNDGDDDDDALDNPYIALCCFS